MRFRTITDKIIDEDEISQLVHDDMIHSCQVYHHRL